MRISGRGVQDKNGPGDLYLILRPVLPSSPDEETMKLAEALDDRAGGEDVRAGLEL
jgi:hypothetical protein